MWSECLKRGIDLATLSKWISLNPAKHLGLRKGRISPTYQADILIFDDSSSYSVKVSDIMFKNKLTPYSDHMLQGLVKKTILRGTVIYDCDTGKGLIKRVGEII